MLQDIESLLKRGSSEIMREGVRLTEVVAQLKLERGKLQREEVLLREKVNKGGDLSPNQGSAYLLSRERESERGERESSFHLHLYMRTGSLCRACECRAA